MILTIEEGLMMKFQYKFTLGLLLFWLVSSPVFSARPGSLTPAEVWQTTLLKTNVTSKLNQNTAEITIDSNKAYAYSYKPKTQQPQQGLRQHGNVTLSPQIYAIYITIPYTIWQMYFLYEQNKSLDQLHVQAIIVPMDYSTNQPCYSFDTTRADIEKATQQLVPEFMHSATNFQFSAWCAAQLKLPTPI